MSKNLSSNRLQRTQSFITGVLRSDECGFTSVPGGIRTLYGTCYSALTLYYLDDKHIPDPATSEFIQNCQRPTGEYIGPELDSFIPPPGTKHDREHLILHSTCQALATSLHFGIPVQHKLSFVYPFCEPSYLEKWLDNRDFSDAWFEGNNLLSIGQLLVYLRDFEKYPPAASAVELWFNWLDSHVDPSSGLWLEKGKTSLANAIYGGYHQLLVYYHENHKITNPGALVDAALSLQHIDGSFSPSGNGGACEDVDCVDILVNIYKRYPYRRGDIRYALKRCLRHILSIQNPNGGFPYRRDRNQSHMGIPGTSAGPNVSTAFATWFRIHTLALIAQVLPDEKVFAGSPLGFTNNLSMGWHASWDPAAFKKDIGKFEPARFLIKDLTNSPRLLLFRLKKWAKKQLRSKSSASGSNGSS